MLGHRCGLGPGASLWEIGDKVCALLPGGGYAEYAATHESHALPVPEGMSMRDAACLPETCFTVWSNVVMRGGLKAGEKFLVHGGTSGIGTTAIQIAHALGARVFATAGSDDKARFCEGLGAEQALNYRTGDWATACKNWAAWTSILDMVGGPYIQQNLKALADDGRLVQIAFLQGAKAEVELYRTDDPPPDHDRLDPAPAIRPRQGPHRSPGRGSGLAHDRAGCLQGRVDSEYPLHEAPAAHWRIEAPGHIGKIVLKVEE